MMERLEKKGAIEVYQIVITVIAIASLAAMLFLWMNFKDVTEQSDEACKFSVLLRATSFEATQNFIPLKCATKKVCIVEDYSNKCKKDFAGEDNVKYVKVPSPTDEKKRKKAIDIINEVNAEAMFQCWEMFGGGKYDLFGNYLKSRALTETKGSYCAICSRIAIDEGVDKRTIEGLNFPEYIKNTKVPGKDITYLQAFTDREFDSYPSADVELQSKSSEQGSTKIEYSGRQIAYVFMQVKSHGYGDALSNLGSDAMFAGTGVFIIPPLRSAGLSVISLAKGIFLKVAVVTTVVAGAVVATNVYSQQQIAAGYCGPFVSKNDAENEGGKMGCSLIQEVPYSISGINNLCDNIEGMK